MTYGIKLKVWGERACFTRPEMKVERVSYDAMTPSAARGILEAIHWKPAIRWIVNRIHVLKPIRFESIRRNEVGHKISAQKAKEAMNAGRLDGLQYYVDKDNNRQQRAATLLREVAYVIEAHFELTPKAAPEDTEAKHISMFKRRAESGQCFHQPCLGTREFAAHFELLDGDPPPSALPPDQRDKDLGFMLHDIDFAAGRTARFFRAQLKDGVIHVPPLGSAEVRA